MLGTVIAELDAKMFNALDPNSLVGKIILGFIRHSFTVGAGALVEYGLISKNQGDELVAAGIAIVVVGLSAYDKFTSKYKPPTTIKGPPS